LPVEVCGLGLCMMCSYMAENTGRGICGNRIHRSILAEVLLYIGVATGLAIGCRPGDTYRRCCFVLADEIYFAEVVVVAGAAVVEALALRAHLLVDEGVLLRIAALSELLFSV
jgi:hypothetical protein